MQWRWAKDGGNTNLRMSAAIKSNEEEENSRAEEYVPSMVPFPLLYTRGQFSDLTCGPSSWWKPKKTLNNSVEESSEGAAEA